MPRVRGARADDGARESAFFCVSKSLHNNLGLGYPVRPGRFLNRFFMFDQLLVLA